MKRKKFGEKRNWDQLKTILITHDSFVFSTHLEPDADGLGSELGLARFLKQQGKTVHILNPSPIRENLEFLTRDGEVQVFDSNQHASIVSEADVFIAFDIGHYDRLGDLRPSLESSDCLKISIDHHPGNKSQFKHRFDFPTASSTGVLIYDILRKMNVDAIEDTTISKPLYAAIMSDTGNFRFNNTDPETFAAAADLVATGVKPYELYVHIYEDLNTQGRLHVLQKLISELKYDCEGRLAWSVIDFEEMSALGATPNDLHSLSDFIRSIKGVEIGISITKMPHQPTDVSLRSKGHISINGVAKYFDGGGHAFAAGCHIEGLLASAVDAVVEQCRLAIEDWDSSA